MCPRGLVQKKKTYAIVLQGCKIDPKYVFDFDLDLEEYLAFARISEAHKKNRGTGEGNAGTYYPILTYPTVCPGSSDLFYIHTNIFDQKISYTTSFIM